MRAGIRRRLAMRSLISGRNARLPALLLEQGDSCVIEAHKDFAPQPLAGVRPTPVAAPRVTGHGARRGAVALAAAFAVVVALAIGLGAGLRAASKKGQVSEEAVRAAPQCGDRR